MPLSSTRRARRARILKMDDRLAEAYPDAGCELAAQAPLDVLIATILSAQCTDAKVNEVLPTLFDRYPDADALAEARQRELEGIIRPIGLHHAKAKNIIACCRLLRDEHGGRVPEEMDALIALPGVGRKTANCVLVNAYGKPGLMTDTHFCRIAQRLGLTTATDPQKIERSIADLLPPARWGMFSHRVIIYGRRCCIARRPRCDECPVRRLCATGQEA